MFIASKSLLVTGLALVGLAAPSWAQGDDQSIDAQIQQLIDEQLTPELNEFDRRAGLIDEAAYLRELTRTSLEESLMLNISTFYGSFGGSFTVGGSSYVAVPSIPGIVFGGQGGNVIGATTLQELETTPLDLSANPQVMALPAGAIQSFAYTGRIGTMGKSVGIMTRVDLRLLGIPAAQGAGDWRYDCFVPRATLDETRTSADTARAFIAQSIAGGFDAYQGIAGWLDTASLGGGDSPGGGGDLQDCLIDAITAMQLADGQAWFNYRVHAFPIEQSIDQGDAWAEMAAGGAIGLAGGGWAGSGLPVIGNILCGAAGGIVGAAGGLLTWALSGPSAAEIAEGEALLSGLKDQYLTQRCIAVNNAKNRIIECFQTHDPANAGIAAALAQAWAASEGC